MSILNIDIDKTTFETQKNQVLYDRILYRDDIANHDCIILDVDNDINPILIGKLITAYHYNAMDYSTFEYKFNAHQIKYSCPGEFNGVIDPTKNIRNHIQLYYNNGWKIPTKGWMKSRFGATRQDKWKNVKYDKFRYNLLETMCYEPHSSSLKDFLDDWYDINLWIYNEDVTGVFSANYETYIGFDLRTPNSHIMDNSMLPNNMTGTRSNFFFADTFQSKMSLMLMKEI